MSKLRYAKQRDANEKEIVEALESIGCTVFRLDTPCDLLVGRCGANGRHNFLIEVKTPTGKFTKAQQKFIPAWKGQIRVLETVDEAIELVTKAYTDPPVFDVSTTPEYDILDTREKVDSWNKKHPGQSDTLRMKLGDTVRIR